MWSNPNKQNEDVEWMVNRMKFIRTVPNRNHEDRSTREAKENVYLESTGARSSSCVLDKTFDCAS